MMHRPLLVGILIAALSCAACERKPGPPPAANQQPAGTAPQTSQTAPEAVPSDARFAIRPEGGEVAERPKEPEAPEATPGEPPAATPTPKEGEVVNRIETPSGLIIEDLVIGEGEEVKPFATVTIHYRGTLSDGKEFDSSYGRGQPATFSLQQLIKGWQEGIPGMKVGGKRRLIVPPELGYGARGSPPVIPPNAMLVFEIELLDIPR